MTQFDVKAQKPEMTVLIKGPIDENSRFVNLDLNGFNTLVLDLNQVAMINSMGLKNWLLWIKKLPTGMVIKFQNCPRNVVDQMNILQGFLPSGALVESFYVPYVCSDCGHEKNQLAVRKKDFHEATTDTPFGINLPETQICPKCQGELEIDVVPNKYYYFLQLRRKQS